MAYLSWKDIEQIGNDIISEYKRRYIPEKRMCYTVDPMQLASMLGYQVDFAYLSRKGNVLGLTSLDEVCISVLDSDMQVMMYYLDGRSILIDERLRNDPRTIGRLNFSILHEVAHQTLDRMYPEEGNTGPRFRCDYRRIPENKPQTKGWREWQADALATVLLLPEDAIKEHQSRKRSVPYKRKKQSLRHSYQSSGKAERVWFIRYPVAHGKEDTLLKMQQESEYPKMSMPRQRKNAKQNWQN